MPTILKTNVSVYIFDSENPELVLKANGRFSSVYLGTRVSDKVVVVIKKLKEPDDYRTSLRFQKESVMGLGFSGVSQTLDAHKDETGYYIIKEFIDGKSLRNIYRAGVPNPELFFVKCMIGVLEILRQFHNKNIFHCDIRPDNILVLNNKRGNPDYITPDVRLIDFGLSKNADENFAGEYVPFSLIYSPPEQLLNYAELVDASSDLFSLGITLYECISKAPPFFNEHPETVMHLQLNSEIENKNKINATLFSVLQKATSKKKLRLPPAQLEQSEIIETIKAGKQSRFQNCDEIGEALKNILPVLQHPKKKGNFFARIFK
jgi:eukaryotic-like serine/threonine-protein kinase